MAPAYVHQPFPAWRFHASLPARIVHSMQEADALGAGWVESPAQLPAPGGSGSTPGRPAPLPAEAHMPAEGHERPTPDETGLLPGETALDPPPFSPEAEALYATPGGDAAADILASDDVEALELTREMELANPKYEGGRKTVLRAIEQRLAHLKG